MIPRDWLKKIRQIEIRTFRLVEDILAGQYQSVFKGRGMDFEEVREYQPGDDVRRIDWNVTARTGIPHIKKFVEERELTVMLLVDTSASGVLGSQKQTKRELAAEIAALLAFSAIRNNDKVGLILFSDQVEKFVVPKKGRSHVLRVVRDVLFFKPESKGTSLAEALHYLNHVVPRRSVVFVISDFLDKNFEKALKITNQRHDMIAITIADKHEKELPNIGWVVVEDSETGDVVEINTSDPKARKLFTELNQQRRSQLKKSLRVAGLDSIDLETDKPYLNTIRGFFDARYRRARG
jgi:uncharacterized protein (DUF58 family)